MGLLQKLHGIFNRNSTGDLKVVTTAIDNILTQTDKDLQALELEYSISTATGEWLDEWATWFGLYRNGEDDESFRARIKLVLLKTKATIPAIIQEVKRVMGDDTYVKVFEPYNNVKLLSVSTLSGKDRFQDGEYWRMSVIDITIDKPITTEVIEAVDKIRGAGIKVLFTYNASPDIVYMSDMTDPLSNSATLTSTQGVATDDFSDSGLSGGTADANLSGSQAIWSDTQSI
jgi:hypothetical protein